MRHHSCCTLANAPETGGQRRFARRIKIPSIHAQGTFLLLFQAPLNLEMSRNGDSRDEAEVVHHSVLPRNSHSSEEVEHDINLQWRGPTTEVCFQHKLEGCVQH